MVWKKEGIIFTPNHHEDWMVTHAQVPTALVMEDRLTVFFATRNTAGQSHIAKLDLDSQNPKKIIALHKNPVLKPGKPGTFDEDGVMPSSIVRFKDKIWLYYTGWNKKVSTPYHNAIGVAVSHDNGDTFTRLHDGPILDRTLHEPYMAITPYVIAEQNSFKMWYASGIRWVKVAGKYEPVYVIKYATSADGLTWQRAPQICIMPRHEQEALCSPTVIFKNNCYKMWFSYRDSTHYRDGNSGYRIGYATSQDGISWERMDRQAGIELSESGWDSTMICYPCVFQHRKQLYMLYNGNSFGGSGFGYATQED
jgi:predicted GH43/DUF377 family glycosyl hydrolase